MDVRSIAACAARLDKLKSTQLGSDETSQAIKLLWTRLGEVVNEMLSQSKEGVGRPGVGG